MTTSELVKFNDDGTITVKLDKETTIRLACPRLVDYRAFRNDINARRDAIVELRDKVIAGKATPEEQKEFTDTQDVVITEWLTAVFEVISDVEDYPTVDEWPAWIGNPSIPARFLSHWQTAPFDSGN